MDWTLAIGYAGGITVHLLDRVAFILAEGGEGKTLGGFLRRNWPRLLSRAIVAVGAFAFAVENDWLTHWFVAACVGLSIDKVTESLLDHMKRTGEGMVQKLKGTGDGK